jgi:transposase
VIKVGTLAKIRRLYHRDKQSIKEISRQTGLSRNTVRSWLRQPAMVEPKYPKRVVLSQLDAYAGTLRTWLKADAVRGKRERRTKGQMWRDLCALGYSGSYSRVCAFARLWKINEGLAASKAAFIPLKFQHGEAFQFDWSTEYAFIGGIRRRVELAHTKLCASRAFWLVAYPGQGHEMLFDAHARAFAAFGGVPQRGIYDNMKTAVDQVLAGKKRKINSRFEAMTGHYLFEPEFCNVASGWEKGIVEKNVRDRRTSIWHRAKERRWANWEELNTWLAEQSKSAWNELNHPEYPTMKVAEVLQDEQTRLMPVPRPFDGYVELLARVSSTGLIHLERNRYSVPTEHAHSMVSLRVYHDHISAVADGHLVARHPRSFERSQTFYDWQHYIRLVERKPGGLRNGAPFESMPGAFKQLQAILLRKPGGDAIMAQVLSAVPVHGLDAVLVAVELALEAGKPSGEHVLNVLARLKGHGPAANLSEQVAAQLVHWPRKLQVEPQANVNRYDRLRTHPANAAQAGHGVHSPSQHSQSKEVQA